MFTSIILVTHNSLNYLKECLNHLILCTHTPFELIIIDNASSDGTQGWLKQKSLKSRDMKRVKIVLNRKNKYFTAAVNQGIRLVRGDFIAVLNADVVVSDDWLSKIIEHFEALPRAAAIGPLMGGVIKNREFLYNQGYENRYGKLPFEYPPFKVMRRFAKTHFSKYRGRYLEAKLICFGCVVFRREVLQSVGGLDEGFFLRGDDWEWCLRARMAGYRIYIAEDVFVLHYTLGSIKSIPSPERKKLNEGDREHWINLLYSLSDPSKPQRRLTMKEIMDDRPFLDLSHRFSGERVLSWSDLFVNSYPFCYGDDAKSVDKVRSRNQPV